MEYLKILSTESFWSCQILKLSHLQTLDLLGSVVWATVPSQCGETFSLVVAESMALGTPVVASNTGGPLA